MSYLKTIYGNYKKSIYPDQLCNYLIDRYDIEKGSIVLDVGCGCGFFMDAFDNNGMRTWGIDREEGHVKSRVVKDLEKNKIPYGENMFDVVFTKSVIEHIHNPDNLINECKRVLKPNGLLIILTPDWISQKDVFYEDYTHVHPYTTTSVKDMLKIHGFKYVETELFYQLPILWKYKYLKLIVKMLQLILKPKLKRFENKFIRWSIEKMVLGTGRK